MVADEKVLSFGDSLIRRSDVELLRGPYWLNDTMVSFYLEVLGSQHAEAQVLALSGATTFMMLHGSAEDAAQQLTSLQALGMRLVLFPVNDNPLVDKPNGGTHWTLLAHTVQNATWHHYDSSGGGGNNERAARQIAAKLAPLCRTDYTFETSEVPQQSNSYDCGVHVLATARVLCEAAAQHRTPADAATQTQLWQQNQPAAVKHLRADILAMFE